MKRTAVALILAVAFASFAFAWRKSARASAAEPPSKITPEQAIKLDRDLAHIREAEASIVRIQEAARPYADDAKTILDAAKIDVQAFNRGEIRIDFHTGEITRQKVASK